MIKFRFNKLIPGTASLGITYVKSYVKTPRDKVRIFTHSLMFTFFKWTTVLYFTYRKVNKKKGALKAPFRN